MRTIKFRIKRFDGSKSWQQEYALPYENGRTMLWALTKIREDLDPTFNFTSACRHAICGSCAVKINGHSFLVCKTSLDEMLEVFATDEIQLAPLNNFRVIRDLVVDWRPKTVRIKAVKPWLIPTAAGRPEAGFIQPPTEFKAIASPTDCIQCGICSSECEQLAENSNFLDPFMLNRAYRFAVDSRDAAPEEHIKPAVDELWKCLHCHQCVTACPKHIRLDREIAYLRQESMHMGETANLGARHAYAFHDDVRAKGRLNEMTLPLKTEGLVGTVTKRIPFALRMVRRGKINPLSIPKAVHGIEGVRKLYAHVQEGQSK
ncbi:MAG TPA: succinate dehydrogenase/fumarate reductase iron-sulfur subunit [Symbiobacteriaceae bacterium]|nr:succinate dehydrogenase/fumarate reductase iron-sulfur subunit [Symbiobacteriaceae bacterium]